MELIYQYWRIYTDKHLNLNLHAPSHNMQRESISLEGHVICSYNWGYI